MIFSYACIVFLLAITLASTDDIEFVSDGTVAFVADATESELTNVINAKEDTMIEDVECITITLGLDAFTTATVLGDKRTAMVCVLDGTGIMQTLYNKEYPIN